jgi:hypothetical protein
VDAEILQALGRILEALKLPITALIAGGSTVLVFRFRGRRGESEALPQLTEAVRELHGEVQAMRHALDEMSDRLEFTERALTRGTPPESPPR